MVRNLRRRNGLMASSVMGMLLSLSCELLISRRDAPLRYPLGCVGSRRALPRERFSLTEPGVRMRGRLSVISDLVGQKQV
jgi:hypothetical protein